MHQRFVGGLAAMLISTACLAATPTSESIDTLLVLTKSERILDSMSGTIDRSMTMGMRSAFGNQTPTPEQERVIENVRVKMNEIFHEEMRWERLKPIYVQVYQQTFTQDEVDGLIAFYRTPAGQALIDKMPQALQATLEALQPITADMMRKGQEVARQAVAEARNAR
jgi:hypothetical protein